MLNIIVLFGRRVALVRGNKIPHFWQTCKIVEINATAFTRPKIWVKHDVLRSMY